MKDIIKDSFYKTVHACTVLQSLESCSTKDSFAKYVDTVGPLLRADYEAFKKAQKEAKTDLQEIRKEMREKAKLNLCNIKGDGK